MSVSNHPQQTHECHHCTTAYELGYDGQFCSEKCLYAHRGEKALNQIRQDHRVCGTCAGQLKTVSPPTESWKHEYGDRERVAINAGAKIVNADDPDVPYGLDLTECSDRQRTHVEAVIGYQYRTDEATDALTEIHGPDENRNILKTTTGCICGSTDHSTTSDILRECDPVRVLTKYVETFRDLYDTGAIDRRIDKRTFFEAYRDERDFEYALGRGLYAGDDE